MALTFISTGMNSSAPSIPVRVFENTLARQSHSAPVTGSFSLSYNSSPVILAATNSPSISVQNLDINELRHAIAKVSDCPDLTIIPESAIRPEDGYFLTVSWNGCSGNKNPLTLSSSSLSGGASGSPSVTVTTIMDGAAGTKTFEPIPLQWLYTARNKPEVIVTVNSVDSHCALEDSCAYTIQNKAPIIASHSWTVSNGTYTATMSTNPNLTNVISVNFGTKVCTNPTYNTTSKEVTCTIKKSDGITDGIDLQAGDYDPLILFNDDHGYAVRNTGVTTLSLTANITGYDLADGPQNGGV